MSSVSRTTDLERLAQSLGALAGRVETATAREPDAEPRAGLRSRCPRS